MGRMNRRPLEEAVVRRRQWTWRVRPELANKASGIEKRIAGGRDKPGARLLKETGGRRTIWTMPLKRGSGKLAFVKHYSKPSFLKQLKHLFRHSRTRQEWEMGVALEGLGLPVARHIAMGEKRLFGLLMEDYLIQEYLEGYENFDAWFRERGEQAPSRPEAGDRRQVIEALAGLIRKMHDRGVLQRDFKPDSIIVGPNGDLKLVDLERVLIRKGGAGLSMSDRIVNLAKIDQTFGFIGSTADRLRFLARYFKDQGLSSEELARTAAEISRLAEISFRKRAREVRIWAHVENESYSQYAVGDYRVSAYLDVHRKFIESVIDKIDRAAVEDLVCSWEPEYPEVKVPLRGVWCDAREALGNSPYLYCRKAPFVPARAAIYPSSGPWGLLLYLRPGPPLMTWKKGAETAMADGNVVEFAKDLGRSLRVLHRMGITWSDYRNDAMLYDPTHPDPLLRFYVNRLDLLLLGRSPAGTEAEKILDIVSELLDLPREADRTMKDSYRTCRTRWFRGQDRW
jgi:hypothetical protein